MSIVSPAKFSLSYNIIVMSNRKRRFGLRRSMMLINKTVTIFSTKYVTAHAHDVIDARTSLDTLCERYTFKIK